MGLDTCFFTCYSLAWSTTTGSVSANMIVPASTSAYRLRSSMRISLDVPKTLSRSGDLAFSVATSRLWNTFNQDLLNAKTLHNFKTQLRNYAIHKVWMFSTLTRTVKRTLFTGPMSLINAFFASWTLI